jgi:N utilization substance protein B
MLFQIDLTSSSPEEVFQHFWNNLDVGVETREFAQRLVSGVHSERDDLDRRIAGSAEHWRIDRMAVVDRNVLRMAVYEMLGGSGPPAAVVIDEAIEVAKKFGSSESGSFINGILDSVRLQIERAGRPAPGPGREPS